MKHRIIGDIHGRTNWKQLISKDAINVFLGDYFAPYDDVSFDDCQKNFFEILNLEKQGYKTILLLGNHDIEWFVKEEYTRHDYTNAEKITTILDDNIDRFQLAYAFDDKFLCSHAGVSQDWVNIYKLPDSNLAELVNGINNLFFSNPNAFNFKNNSAGWDCYGNSRTHSPVWIRPTSLEKSLLKNIKVTQIVGHSQVPQILMYKGVVYCDCLGKTTSCVEVDNDTVNLVTYTEDEDNNNEQTNS